MDIFGPQFNQTQIMSGVTSTNINYGRKKIAGSKVNICLERMTKLHIVVSCGSIPKIVDFLDRGCYYSTTLLNLTGDVYILSTTQQLFMYWLFALHIA